MGRVYIEPTSVVRGDQTTAGRFSTSRFGGPTSFTLTSSTVGTSVGRIVLNNPKRVKLTLLNIGANDVYVAFTSTVSTSFGMKLVAATGVLDINVSDDGEQVISEIYGISGTAGQTVMVEEIFRV